MCLSCLTNSNVSILTYPPLTVEVLKSNRTPMEKVIWCLVVFLFPIVGMIVYFIFSNRAAHNSGGAYEPLP